MFYNFTLDWLTDGEDTWTPVGISDLPAAESSLKIYPVPAANMIRVETPGIREVTIMNMSGQIVNTLFNDGSSQVELDVSNLPAGVYLIECKNAHGQRTSAKFIR